MTRISAVHLVEREDIAQLPDLPDLPGELRAAMAGAAAAAREGLSSPRRVGHYLCAVTTRSRSPASLLPTSCRPKATRATGHNAKLGHDPLPQPLPTRS